MIKVTILSVGKTKEEWLEEALAEYEKRLSRDVKIEWIIVKDDRQLQDKIGPGAFCLDPQGKSFSSESFATFVAEQGSRMMFVIGGPAGLPPRLKLTHPLLCLSSLTFTHQITRLVLAEQIYRAFTILSGKPYHKA